MCVCACVCVCVCVCVRENMELYFLVGLHFGLLFNVSYVCVCVHVYVVYEDTN